MLFDKEHCTRLVSVNLSEHYGLISPILARLVSCSLQNGACRGNRSMSCDVFVMSGWCWVLSWVACCTYVLVSLTTLTKHRITCLDILLQLGRFHHTRESSFLQAQAAVTLLNFVLPSVILLLTSKWLYIRPQKCWFATGTALKGMMVLPRNTIHVHV